MTEHGPRPLFEYVTAFREVHPVLWFMVLPLLLLAAFVPVGAVLAGLGLAAQLVARLVLHPLFDWPVPSFGDGLGMAIAVILTWVMAAALVMLVWQACEDLI